jgi:glycosyltransferase involved in cell wall biosynthesis
MDQPLFTVVVPTRDRPRPLEGCLAALAALDFPGGHEVLVVDDGSREPVRIPAGAQTRVVRLDGRGPAAARNAGAAAARGRWLAFLDDDCRPRPDWLSALQAHLEKEPQALVGGRTVNVLVDNPWSAASQLLVDWLYTWYGARGGGGRFFTTSNLAVATVEFRHLGGFDESFPHPGGEDRDLCERWAARGLPFDYAPEAIVDHAHPLGPRSFWRQHVAYGQGARLLHRRRAERGVASRIEPPAFYLGMLRHPFARRVARPLRQAALLTLAQIANVAGYLSARSRG